MNSVVNTAVPGTQHTTWIVLAKLISPIYVYSLSLSLSLVLSLAFSTKSIWTIGSYSKYGKVKTGVTGSVNSHWTERTCSGFLSQPLLFLYCTSLFSLNTSTPTAAFISAEGKEEQSRGGCD